MRSLLHCFIVTFLCGSFVAGHVPALIHHATCGHSVKANDLANVDSNTVHCACGGHGDSKHHESSPSSPREASLASQAGFHGIDQVPQNESHHHDASSCLICQSLTGVNGAILVAPQLQGSPSLSESTGSAKQLLDLSCRHRAFLARGPPATC